MNRKLLPFMLLISVLPICMAAAAKDLDPVKPIAAPAPPSADNIGPLKPLIAAGATITYLGPYHGLDGWLVTNQKDVQTVYTTADGQAGVVGLLYSASGEAETAVQIDEARKKGTLPAQFMTAAASSFSAEGAATPATVSDAQAQSPGERLWAQVQKTQFFSVGDSAAPLLYVFMDPNCGHCQKYWQALIARPIPASLVQLRVVPVGSLGAASQKKAAQLVSTQDQEGAWTAMETGDDSKLAATATPDADAAISRNNDIMREWKMTGTPTSVYRAKDGKIRMIYGEPDKLDDVLADLGKG